MLNENNIVQCSIFASRIFYKGIRAMACEKNKASSNIDVDNTRGSQDRNQHERQKCVWKVHAIV